MTDCTVIITTSPIPSHPSTEIIEQTIAMTRDVLPDAPIVILCDGVRPEQESMRGDYEEALDRMQRLVLDGTWPDVSMIHYDQFSHQSGMVATELAWAEHGAEVTTPVLLFVEHDMPPLGPLPVDAICEAIASGVVDVMRLNINTALEPCHDHMLIDHEPVDIGRHGGLLAQRTWQWSSCTHFASTDYYRRIAADHLAGRRTYIEWVMSGVVVAAYQAGGIEGWKAHKVWIFTPEGDQRRCIHLDGRQGGTVWDDDGNDVTVHLAPDGSAIPRGP